MSCIKGTGERKIASPKFKLIFVNSNDHNKFKGKIQVDKTSIRDKKLTLCTVLYFEQEIDL
ncbi:hypothetical protein NCCP28_21130 [Niallia sp. NCCP-28]|nr:hypothetical protein NCCP28_21130 [Niallia sp. NCCP-28]